MKVALTADTQFDQQLNYATIGDDGVSSRLRDSIECFDWIVDEAVKRKCEKLFVLGDIFDSRTTLDLAVIDQVCRVFGRASKRIGVVGTVGNHDSYLRSARINSVQMFKGVAEVVETPSVLYGLFAIVPWIEDDDEFAAAVKLLADTEAKYLFGHCMIDGAVPGVAKARSPELLMPKRWKQIVLGDVHEPIVVSKTIRYCGSPMQWHFGDAGRKRGFLVLDTTTGAIEFVENKLSPRFHLLDAVPDPKTVRADDFVRIRVEDVGLATEVAQAVAPSKPQRMESEAVEIEETTVRLGISVHDGRAEVLARYVEHLDLSDAEGLVDVGLEILDEALHA